MDLQTHGTVKYPTTELLETSANRGWSTISVELRSHQPIIMPASVPTHTEIGLMIIGNKNCLIKRTGAGQTQCAAPTTGAIWISPIGVGDDEATLTASVPQSLHLYLPEFLFSRLRDDFKLPSAPAHSIRYVSGIRDPVIQQIGNSLLCELTNETAAGRMYAETASMMLAARLLQKHCESGTCAPIESSLHPLDDSRLRRVFEYIAAHIKDDISIEKLAKIACYSPFHFARKFTLATGIPPHRYISRMRIENAMEELAAGKLPLAQIALNANFSSQASFTRAFHRTIGMTPKEYQRQRR
jgi:AraC family transcriptional regulator